MTAISVTTFPSSTSPVSSEPVERLIYRLNCRLRTKATGVFGCCVMAALSLGLAPLCLWPGRWNRVRAIQQQDFGQVARWWQARTSAATANQLDWAVQRMGGSSLLSAMPVLIFSMLAIFVGWELCNGATIADFQHFINGRRVLMFFVHGDPMPVSARSLWMICLGLAYGCYWLTVRHHLLAVQAFIDGLNQAVGHQRFSINSEKWGLNPLWILGGVMFGGVGLWWAIPMLLAGAMQRRYVRVTMPKLRSEIAQHLTDAAGVQFQSCCKTPRCGEMLKPSARFCSRCGARVDISARQRHGWVG